MNVRSDAVVCDDIILRRLDEIERKLDRIIPTAVGYSVGQGQSSEGGLITGFFWPHAV